MAGLLLNLFYSFFFADKTRNRGTHSANSGLLDAEKASSRDAKRHLFFPNRAWRAGPIICTPRLLPQIAREMWAEDPYCTDMLVTIHTIRSSTEYTAG